MVNILEIDIYDKGHKNAVNKIVKESTQNKKRNLLVSATGAHGLITAKKNVYFDKVLRRFYLNLPDGVPCVWVGHLKGAKKMTRCYGPDFFRDVITMSANKKVNHFLCGGKPGVARELKGVCNKKFNNGNIVGLFSPPFRVMTDKELINLSQKINSAKADIIWIGLGTPKQEYFAEKLSHFVNVKFIITVGAAFDFHTGRIRQAPKIIQNVGMEWFFRLCMEPKRLWRRYFEIVPAFIYYNLKEIIFFHKN